MAKKKKKKKRTRLRFTVIETFRFPEAAKLSRSNNMAYWNKNRFRVSAKELTALTGLSISDSYNDEYDDNGKKVGRERTTFTANVTYFTVTAGKYDDARSAMKKWQNMVGKKAYFYVGGKKLFTRKCILLKVTSDNIRLANKGEILAVDLTLEFQWARTAKQEKAAKKEAKQSATKATTSSSTTTSSSGGVVVTKSSGGGGSYNGGRMSWPLPGHTYVSSNYGPRNCPFHGRETHSGIDLPAPAGTSIVAAAPGTVVLAGYNGSYGNCVIISHGKSVWTLYGHQSSVLVRKGQRVSAKQKIGKVGSTGNSTGNHLHFEVRKGANSYSNHTSPWNYVKR